MKKTGTIETLNVSPKGFHEGFLLRTGKRIVQINLAKDSRGAPENGLSQGVQITVEIEPEEPHGEPCHDVFRLVRLLGANGESPEGAKHESQNFSGRVETLNYALHGEVNGGILDSGDFLHLKPGGARALKLKVGMQVDGKGRTKPMVGGHSVIEAELVNGIVIRQHKAKSKHTKH